MFFISIPDWHIIQILDYILAFHFPNLIVLNCCSSSTIILTSRAKLKSHSNVVKGGIALAALTSNALNREKTMQRRKMEQRENKLQSFWSIVSYIFKLCITLRNETDSFVVVCNNILNWYERKNGQQQRSQINSFETMWIILYFNKLMRKEFLLLHICI